MAPLPPAERPLPPLPGSLSGAGAALTNADHPGALACSRVESGPPKKDSRLQSEQRRQVWRGRRQQKLGGERAGRQRVLCAALYSFGSAGAHSCRAAHKEAALTRPGDSWQPRRQATPFLESDQYVVVCEGAGHRSGGHGGHGPRRADAGAPLNVCKVGETTQTSRSIPGKCAGKFARLGITPASRHAFHSLPSAHSPPETVIAFHPEPPIICRIEQGACRHCPACRSDRLCTSRTRKPR